MWDAILKAVQQPGLLLVLVCIVVLVGAAAEWWVWGVVYRREIREKEYWRGKAFDLMGLGEEAVELASDLKDSR